MKYNYIILGAGPAGLTFANVLKENGINDFLILEKESEAGGLCRSSIVDGSPLDIGGGHFLDVKRREVLDFLFKFMPEDEWKLYIRDSRIRFKDYELGHPFEANIWQLPDGEQKKYLESISRAGCNVGKTMPHDFVSWINWKLGDAIAEDYMLPYNCKMFGNNLNQLGTYWLEKLPNVSYEETLESCRLKKPCGTQPGHATFYYPKKYGYGELWKRMGEELGSKLVLGETVNLLDLKEKKVISNLGNVYNAKVIINTVPWNSFETIIGIPDCINDSLNELKHSSIEVKYYSESIDNKAHWIYYPDEKKSFHRILLRNNFCSGSRGYWTETNTDRMIKDSGDSLYSYINEYAYPLNTINKPQVIKELLEYCEKSDVYGLGRWGEHQHYNSDLVVEKAINLAYKLLHEKSLHN